MALNSALRAFRSSLSVCRLGLRRTMRQNVTASSSSARTNCTRSGLPVTAPRCKTLALSGLEFPEFLVNSGPGTIFTRAADHRLIAPISCGKREPALHTHPDCLRCFCQAPAPYSYMNILVWSIYFEARTPWYQLVRIIRSKFGPRRTPGTAWLHALRSSKALGCRSGFLWSDINDGDHRSVNLVFYRAIRKNFELIMNAHPVR
jgi:hypothetical protein